MRLSGFGQLRSALLFFFLFFSIVAIAQYLFVRRQTEAIFKATLRDNAADLNRAISYNNGVDLAAFSKYPINASNYVAALNDGTLLDLLLPNEGVPKDFLPPVQCPVCVDAMSSGPMSVRYTSGAMQPETWTIQAKRLEDGHVVVGYSEYDHVTRGPERLRINIGALGSTVAVVNRQAPKALDNEMSWVLIDSQNRLINGAGRIPVKTDPMDLGRRSVQPAYRHFGATTYFVLYAPITDKAGNRVGTMILPQRVDFFNYAVRNLTDFNIAIAVLSIAIFLILSFFYYSKHEREKRELKESFQNYFSPQIMEAILKEPERLTREGQRREVTVLFSDIRSFTALTERLAPQQLTRLLQEYFSEMSDAVFATDGVVDKYIGDAIMAFWGAPIEQQDQADRAVRSAIDMTRRLTKLQAKWQAEGLPIIDVGIGINLGIATVGNFGSARRYDYTVIGDTVNAAARLESLNKDYESHIIISESTKAQLTASVDTRDLGEVHVRGKEKPIRIFQVLTP